MTRRATASTSGGRTGKLKTLAEAIGAKSRRPVANGTFAAYFCMRRQRKTAKSLEEIRVADWTMFHQGPVAAMVLADLGADLGADVIKIEDRVTSDPARGVMKLVGVMAEGAGRNAYYEFGNRGKPCLTLHRRN